VRRFKGNELVLWGGIAAVVVVAGVLLWTTGALRFSNPRAALTTSSASLTALATATPSPTATATQAPSLPPGTETPAAATPAVSLTGAPEVTAAPGNQVYLLTPLPDAVGWVRQDDTTPNHFGDYNIYAGMYDGQRYLGAVQFSLADIPPGAPITYADLSLAGLTADWLGSGGTWQVAILKPWLDQNWPKRTYAELAGPDVVPRARGQGLEADDLGLGRSNVLVFGAEARKELSGRTVRM